MTEGATVTAAAVFATVAIFVGVGAFLTWALLKASQRRAPAMVTLSLSLLTMVALLGAIIDQNDALVALAGTGLGALATSMTNLFGNDEGEDHDRPA